MTTPNTNTEQTATSFVEQQLAAAERSLKITRLATTIIVLLVASYAIGMTAWMHYHVLEPTAAADIATAHIVTIAQESGAAISEQVIREVPALVAQVPDFLLEQIPSYRILLEDKFEQTLAEYGRELQPDVEAFLEQFTNENREHVEAFLGAVSDPKLTQRFGDHVEQELLTYLHTPNDRGESALDLLELGRVSLDDVQARLHRLAWAKDLTPEELKLRRIIGATMKAADVKL
jgi:hypothetical protein